ncbi:MAG: rhodanese-related sulfurtransferase [Rhizobiaceae bacterium]|nr:rhodanese-related sulfurtransferase [Rhizobiaceae bacterium]
MQLPHDAPHRVAAFYRFARMDDPPALKRELGALACGLALRGTILVAPEGINGTVAGSAEALERLVARLRALPGCAGMDVKWSDAPERPFHRMKVRLKREIVTMGVDDLDPVGGAGAYVEPADWNALIADGDTVVIDTRNDYEVALGRFSGAVDPGTQKFGDFPAWAQAHRDELAGRKVAMYCTGGIRCEKATAFVKSLGVEEVFHLKGGILKYLEEVPVSESLWQGECFVFDERVGVGHGLEQGEASLCRACRHPLTAEDRASPLYVEGISCHRCHGDHAEQDRARFAERQRQVQLAAARGAAPHIGR